MTPRLLLSKVLTTAVNNTYLKDRISIDTLVDETFDYITSLKADKEEFNTLAGLIRQVHTSPFKYTKQKLLSDIQTCFPDDPDWETYINMTVLDTLSPEELQVTVINEVIALRQLLTIPRAAAVMTRAGFDLAYKQSTVKDVNAFIGETIIKLESIMAGTGSVDAAISTEIDFDSPTDLAEAFDKVSELSNGSSTYKLGWQALNTALQGGPKPGDMMMIGALEHNYKSGMLRTLFRQIAQYNMPPVYQAHEVKKPLLLFFSFEDDPLIILQFMVQNIMYNKTRQPVNVKDYKRSEMIDIVRNAMTKNGWSVKMYRIDPTEWTYRSLISKVVSLEAEGYDTRVIAADYLLQIPTTGCDKSGAQGTDLRDLVRRVRNFMSNKGILFMTPGQLSPSVKDLRDKGIADRDLLSHISERGQYAGSKQISQDLDISLLLNKVRADGATYLDVCLEKHRAATAIEDKLKHVCFPMSPHGMPIIDDVESDTPIHLYRVPSDY